MTHAVCAEHVSYRYLDNQHGLEQISLTVDAGEAVLIAGPSGCGKSTLARCLTGLIPHLYRGTLNGAVRLEGLCVDQAPLWRVAECAGMVFQNPSTQMLASSVEREIVFGLENLGLGKQGISDRLETTLARFNLLALRNRVPQTLSGGEQQKLALAAVMAREPPVLVLDEPLSMLDVSAAGSLVRHLSELSRAGTSVIVCEHRPEHLQAIPDLCAVQLQRPGCDSSEAVFPDLSVPVFHFAVPRFQLEVRGLTVALGSREVLQELDLSAESGQIIAVVGRNGVGKTTLLRALVGLQSYRGTVAVDGKQPDLGMVFQNADLQLFNASVREEILYGVRDPDLEFYEQLLLALGLKQYESVPPLLLSEGEKRRVALASVLMRRPRHGVLLDEPALGQDTAHKIMLMHIARALTNAGQLVIVTTHDLALAAQADRMLLLGEEGWVAEGRPAEVMSDTALWDRIGMRVPSWVSVPSGSEISPARASEL